MNNLFLFAAAIKRDPNVDVWFEKQPVELGAIARAWFDVMRECGDDVRELLHDGHPTACVGEAAFGYVNAFTSHVNIGFFDGTELADPKGLLQGEGKFMRHIKLRPGVDVDLDAVREMIETAYTDIKRRVTP
jgi:hypothetical protein